MSEDAHDAGDAGSDSTRTAGTADRDEDGRAEPDSDDGGDGGSEADSIVDPDSDSTAEAYALPPCPRCDRRVAHVTALGPDTHYTSCGCRLTLGEARSLRRSVDQRRSRARGETDPRSPGS